MVTEEHTVKVLYGGTSMQQYVAISKCQEIKTRNEILASLNSVVKLTLVKPRFHPICFPVVQICEDFCMSHIPKWPNKANRAVLQSIDAAAFSI